MKGQITVFLSLVLSIVLIFLEVSLQSVQMQIARYNFSKTADLVEYSILSEYQRELLEYYDLFYLDVMYGNEREDSLEIRKRMDYYIAANLDKGIAEIKNVTNFSRMTDEKGLVYYEQAVSYQKDKGSLGLLSIETTDHNLENMYERKKGETQGQFNTLNTKRIEAEEGSTENPIETVKEPGSILTLVVENSDQISGKTVSLGNMASSIRTPKGVGTRGIEDKNLLNDVWFHEYLLEKFPNAQKELANVERETVSLNYQLEYILEGKGSDIENLEAVANKLILMRSGINYAYLQTDGARKSQCTALATSIVGVTLVPELVGVVEQLLILAWSYGEAIVDVRNLLSGNQVGLIKTSSTWKVPLSDILTLKQNVGKYDGKTDQSKMDYEAYLKMLLIAEARETKTVRSLDMIQETVREKSGNQNFQVGSCIDGFQTEITYDGIKNMSLKRMFAYEW